MGVSELSVPVSELSIPSSAIQNKKAGNKLPSMPDKKTVSIFPEGIWRKDRTATGSKMIPAETILTAATW